MRATALLVLGVFAMSAVPLPAAAQDEGLFVEFNFETLWFRFYPTGLSGEATGSGLQGFAESVLVQDADAVDLRHCIDGWGSPQCSYGDLLAQANIGDKDGTVEPNEVDAFEAVAGLGAGQIEKVKNLSRMFENNITVDGIAGGRARVTALAVRDGEGQVNSTSPALVDVTIEIDYTNDPKAKRHEMQLESLKLRREGFEYQSVKWVAVSQDQWVFKPSDTVPLTYQTKVTKTGWVSSQNEFEQATSGGLKLVVEKEAKKRSPGPELVALAAAVVVGLSWARRRAE